MGRTERVCSESGEIEKGRDKESGEIERGRELERGRYIKRVGR